MTEKLKNAVVVLIIWLIAGLLYSLQSYYYRLQIGQAVELLSIITVDAPYFLIWALFTPIPVYFSKRFPFDKTSWPRLLIVNFILAMVVAFVHSFIYMWYRLFVTIEASENLDFNRVTLNAIANFDYGILVYFVTLLVLNVLDYYKRLQQEKAANAELQAALVRSQLDTLRVKLQPHFLFNTLNSITVLIKDNPKQAGETVSRLSELLRHVLKNVDDQFTELKNEIEFIRNYLSIEQVRFSDRLNIKIEINRQLHKLPVPSLILQPLVENAVRHGIAKKRGSGLIEVKGSLQNEMLLLEVIDNGAGYNPLRMSKQGLGLKITNDRLKSLYKNNFKMNIEAVQKGGTRTFIEIPLPVELPR